MNDPGDGTDAVPGDTACDSNSITVGLQCTLRAAIEEGNALAGTDSVSFAAGITLIQPLTELPGISQPLNIDGTVGGAPGVRIDGINVTTPAFRVGLRTQHFSATQTEIRGLSITRFSTAISVVSAAKIAGNYLGLDLAGGTSGNTSAGVALFGGPATIGGTTPADRNVISGNVNGVTSNNTGGNTISGNYIGTNVAGTAAQGNTQFGVSLAAGTTNTTVGGSTAGARNVISGNGSANIDLRGSCFSNCSRILGNYVGPAANGTTDITSGAGVLADAGAEVGGPNAGEGNVIAGNTLGLRAASAVTVKGNRIGTGADGSSMPNTTGGVEVYGSNVSIGGAATSDGNIITGNGSHGVEFVKQQVSDPTPLDNVVRNNQISGNSGDGVAVVDGARVEISENSLSLNTGLGIDHGNDGVTANDAAPDSDSGANALQNFPVLTGVTRETATTAVAGRLESAASTAYRIDLYSASTCDASGNGEGSDHLGSVQVATSAGGTAEFEADVEQIAASDVVTATATRLGNGFTAGETSELSACRAAGDPVASVAGSGGDEGDTASFDVTLSAPAGASGAEVSYATANGTATAGSDYQSRTGTLSFGPGETQETVEVPLSDDSADEQNETFELRLSAPRNATLGTTTAQVSIADTDVPPATGGGNPATDRTAPDTSASGPLVTRDRTPTFTLRSTEALGGFLCKLDSRAEAACASPLTTVSLADGRHTLLARARDRSGNTDASPARVLFVVDTRKARLKVKGLPKRGRCSARRSLRVRLSVSDATSIRSLSAKLGRKKVRAKRRKSQRLTLRRLRTGRNKLTVTVVDAAGNRSKRSFSFRRCG